MIKLIEDAELVAGKHRSPADGMCFMEMVSYMAGETWSDHPACVSPVLGAFLRAWNDSLGDRDRQLLKPYAAKVIGTNDGRDEQRAWMCLDWLVRTQLPAWLNLAGLTDHAAAVGSRTIESSETAAAAQSAVEDAGYSAKDFGGRAAWEICGPAGFDAAGAAVRIAGGDSARWAAGHAAWDAAWIAAGAAVNVASGDAVSSTVISLQASAFELLDRMIAVP